MSPAHSLVGMPPPPLPRAARRGVALALAAAHAALLLIWLHSPPARRSLADLMPAVMVSLVPDTVVRPREPEPPLPAPRSEPLPRAPKLPFPDLPPPEVVTRAEAPPAPPPPVARPITQPAVEPAPAAPVVVVPAATAAPPEPPPTVSIHQVSYLTPPVLDYPLASRRQGEEGAVQLRVLIGTDGAPRQVDLLRSSGHRRLDDAAMNAARATRFRPFTENGQPRAVWVVMPLVFELQT